MNIRLSPSRRIIINNKTEPTLVPIHEYKNPFNNPYAALLAIIITSNGKKGRKASMNGKAMQGIGPIFRNYSVITRYNHVVVNFYYYISIHSRCYSHVFVKINFIFVIYD